MNQNEAYEISRAIGKFLSILLIIVGFGSYAFHLLPYHLFPWLLLVYGVQALFQAVYFKRTSLALGGHFKDDGAIVCGFYVFFAALFLGGQFLLIHYYKYHFSLMHQIIGFSLVFILPLIIIGFIRGVRWIRKN